MTLLKTIIITFFHIAIYRLRDRADKQLPFIVQKQFYDTDGLIYKIRNRDTDKENWQLPGGKGGNKLGDWNWHINTTIYKTDN